MTVPTITSESTAFGVVGLDFKYQIKTNFHVIYPQDSIVPETITYSIDFNYPYEWGLSIDPATGWITGQPTLAGDCAILVTAIDNLGNTATKPIVFKFTELPIVSNTIGGVSGVRCCIARSYFISPPASEFHNITSRLTASGMVGEDFFYLILVDFDAVDFSAWGLPDGLGVVFSKVVDQSVGWIVGQPKAPGTYAAVISGSDKYGNEAIAVLIITVEQSSIQDIPTVSVVKVPVNIITSRDFLYSNLLTIPVQAKPNQIVQFPTGSGQSVALKIYQRLYGLFMDVSILQGNLFIPLLGGVICEDRRLIVRSMYFNFSGDIVFVDLLGRTNPHYEGLGNRYQLVYLEPPRAS